MDDMTFSNRERSFARTCAVSVLSRRRFLAAGAAAVAGLVLHPVALRAQPLSVTALAFDGDDLVVARGSEVRTTEQHGLSGYWRWVLAIYGPQILERCGSFRFLFTELVPLQLIARKATSKAQVPAE